MATAKKPTQKKPTAKKPSSVPFEMKGGSPVRLEVTLPNGERYELRVAISVSDVTLLDGRDPSDPSLPAFNIQANFAATTKRLAT